MSKNVLDTLYVGKKSMRFITCWKLQTHLSLCLIEMSNFDFVIIKLRSWRLEMSGVIHLWVNSKDYDFNNSIQNSS